MILAADHRPADRPLGAVVVERDFGMLEEGRGPLLIAPTKPRLEVREPTGLRLHVAAPWRPMGTVLGLQYAADGQKLAALILCSRLQKAEEGPAIREQDRELQM